MKNNDFPVFLMNLLEERSLSLRKLGKISGIDHATLSKIMNGKRKVNITHLEKLSESLDLELISLMEAAGFPLRQKEKVISEVDESLALLQSLMKNNQVDQENLTKKKLKQELQIYEKRSQTIAGREEIIGGFHNKLKEVNGRGLFIKQLRAAYARFVKMDGTAKELALFGGALLYFIITIDLIPDYLIPIGLLDDALIMQTISQHMENKRVL